MTIRRGDSIIAGNAGGIPSQTGQSGKFLTTNGTMASWGDTVDYTNITNCITEIPQDIKLELNDGTLKLKAGSKAYAPNGFEADGTTPKFDVKIIESDIIVDSPFTNGPMLIYYVDNAVVPVPSSWSVSGTSNTTIIEGFSCWYDTTNNIIKLTVGDEVGYSGMSLPLAIINTTSNGDWTSIDQVFNGFGYMGSTVFALPGVKGLIPNGRNADGSLKSIEVILDHVIKRTDIRTNVVGYQLSIYESAQFFNYDSGYIYDGDNNLIKTHNGIVRNDLICATYSTDSSGKITSFTPKTAFHAVDYADYNKCIHDIDSKQDKSTAINYNNISNCITEIPQDIKLELNNGTLTLKAGSKVYIPNGFETSTEPLYAWTVNGNNSEVYYTESETPAVGDKTYNENGTYTGYKVNEVSGTTLVLQKGSGSVVEQVTVTRDTSKDTYFSKPDTTKPKFDVKIIDVDLSIPKWNNTVPGLISITSNREIWIALLEQQYSGISAPTSQWALWYDTTNNKIKSSSDAGSTWKEGYCFPIAICTSNPSKWTSIDQVFNGFGYIGSTVFALPGVKGLIPNGRNADGSLKNIEFTLDKVSTYNCNMSSYFGIKLKGTEPILGIYGEQLYNSSSNTVIFNGVVYKWMYSGSLTYSNNLITSFTPKTVFHALDYNDKSTISGWSMPSNRYIDLTLGASGTSYTAPANGFFFVEKVTEKVSQFLLFNTANMEQESLAVNAGNWVGGFVPVKKGMDCIIHYTASGAVRFFRFIYAEGE